MLSELFLEYFSGKPRAINRAAQFVPEIRDGTNVIFVGMSNNQTREIIFTRLNKLRVRHLRIRFATMVSGAVSTDAPRLRESDTTIDHQPLSIVTIQVHVHADFAGTA